MSRASPAQLERARRLLVHEGAEGTAEQAARAAGRIFDKLHARLDSLLGAAGVQALLDRSARLARLEFSFLEISVVQTSTSLRECLQAHDPAVAIESAAVLFATFFSLITTFIGERLTTQALRIAWPTLGAPRPEETSK